MTSEKESSQEWRQLMVLLVWLEQNPAVEDEESTAQMFYLKGRILVFYAAIQKLQTTFTA